jgi:superfamily I DNA and RNA helicase
LVIAMPRATPTADELAAALRSHGMQALVAGAKRNQDLFRCDGHVTVANIFRAKGNEAWKVYACGVHIAGAPFVADPDEELKRRNQVFTALSRARIWCIAIGLSGNRARARLGAGSRAEISSI